MSYFDIDIERGELVLLRNKRAVIAETREGVVKLYGSVSLPEMNEFVLFIQKARDYLEEKQAKEYARSSR